MIIVQKGEKTRLPKKFHFVNNICAYLYDQITEVLSDSAYDEMVNSNVEFGDDQKLREAFKTANQEHSLDILKRFGRNGDIEIIVSKHVAMSIISDMVNFIYESIIIAQKCKMSVAYALLRKPFTDQLMILEQIMVDRKDFIYRYFHDGDPKNYDPSARDLDKQAIISHAVEKLDFVLFEKDMIYDLRYNKASEAGINAFSNHALHIVTNDKNYKTENQGLNFTFPIEPEFIEEYLEHYYSAVPMLLIYTAAVVDDIIFEFVVNRDGLRQEKAFKRFLASIFLYDDETQVFSKKMFKTLSKILVTRCEICNHINKFTKRDFENYFYEHNFNCKRCFNPVILSSTSFENMDRAIRRSSILSDD